MDDHGKKKKDRGEEVVDSGQNDAQRTPAIAGNGGLFLTLEVAAPTRPTELDPGRQKELYNGRTALPKSPKQKRKLSFLSLKKPRSGMYRVLM